MRVRRIVDLSIVVDDATQAYPGDPRPRLRPATTIEADGFNVLSLAIGSHTGTHVDAPMHMLRGGAHLEQLDLGLFGGPGVVAELRDHAARQPITWAALAGVADRLVPGAILLLRTAWSERYLGTDAYYDHPHLDPDACARVLERGVRTIGIDALNPDPTIVDGDGTFPVHELVFAAGGVICENLTNLGAIEDEEPLVCLFPIRLGARADGAPCRAVALELDER
jgi:kynurenine formamidase